VGGRIFPRFPNWASRNLVISRAPFQSLLSSFRVHKTGLYESIPSFKVRFFHCDAFTCDFSRSSEIISRGFTFCLFFPLSLRSQCTPFSSDLFRLQYTPLPSIIVCPQATYPPVFQDSDYLKEIHFPLVFGVVWVVFEFAAGPSCPETKYSPPLISRSLLFFSFPIVSIPMLSSLFLLSIRFNP